MDEIKEKVKHILKDLFYIEDKEIVPEANLREDFAMDSLDAVEFLMRLEQEFNLNITDDNAENCNTVQDVYNLLEKLVKH